jgi:UDP-3-O-[3-hydroxymyristoyl] N-acetylglucosamine deacetylase
MHRYQKTISHRLQISGKGLHSGETMDAVLSPLPIGSGIWFQRTDNPGARPVRASWENVTDTRLATTIGLADESVGTLEHLLAALYGLGISNLMIEVSGPEVPILDGSASPWASLLKKAGIATLQAPRSFYKVTRPFTVADDDGCKSLTVEPADRFSVDCEIDFPGYVGQQRRTFAFSQSGFVSEIAPARTFCMEKDVEEMKRNGKALGGGLDNAVVFGENGRVLNPEGLRFKDECVRHKILDFLGDLSLAQFPVIGRFTAVRTGHTMNQRFLQALLRAPGVLATVNPMAPSKAGGFSFPSLTPAHVLPPM